MDERKAGVASFWTLLPLRIIVGLLVLGQAAFLSVLLTFDFGPKREEPFFGDFMTFAAAVVVFLAIAFNVALVIVHRRLAAKRENGWSFASLAMKAVGGALAFEFAGFFSATAMMLERSWGAAIMAAAMILGTVSRFPIRP